MAETDTVAESLARMNKAKGKSGLKTNASMLNSLQQNRRKSEVAPSIDEEAAKVLGTVDEDGTNKKPPILNIEESMNTDAILEVIGVSEALLNSDDPEIVRLGVRLGKAIIKR